MINDWWGSTGFPVWFAVSDGGAGYIPWGFWQVAFYPTGQGPGFTNLAFSYNEVGVSAVSASVAGALWGSFQILRGQGIAAGFTRTREMQALISAVQGGSTPNPTESVTVNGPFDSVQLQGFYSGPLFPAPPGEEHAVPMVEVGLGWDNPLFMALWSPGNRAILRATEPPPPTPYGGYPYPGEPPGRIG